MTVLVGGLRVLNANVGQSELGVFTKQPESLTNDFFVNLLDMTTKWEASSSSDDVFEGNDVETEGAANWMGRHFFTGGMMPSEHLFDHFVDDLAIQRQWRVSGLHYWRTCEAWLRNLDRNRAAILDGFREELPAREAKRTVQRWRIFFMACAELFRYRDGNEWFVAHYLFRNAVSTRLQSSHHASRDERSEMGDQPEPDIHRSFNASAESSSRRSVTTTLREKL